MNTQIGPHPTFSWSHSRDRAYSECQRAYYWHWYGSWRGWERDASPEARQAYVLKNLTTLPMTLGQQLHLRASEIAEAIKRQVDPPSFDEILERTRNALNRVCRASRNRESFLRSPKRHPMLLEVFQRRGPSNDQLLRMRSKMLRCLEHLHGSAVWDELRGCAAEDVHLFSSTDAIEYRGTALYAAPDLVWRDADGRWIILDWKTGSEDLAGSQLVLYSMALRERLGAEPPMTGRIVNLDSGEDRTIEITAGHIAAAERRVSDSIWEMSRHLVDLDPVRNVARGRESFELSPNVDRCSRCPFFELCEEELDQAQYLGPF